jgi:hypothetical protein
MNIYKPLEINKTMKYLLLSIILILLIFPTISAGIPTLGDGDQYECITLRQKYANSTYANVTTLTYPNQTQVDLNLLMNGSNGNWHYSFCDTEQLGLYEYCTRIDIDGVDTDMCLNFNITTGDWMFWIILVLSFSFIFLLLSVVVREELFVYISGVCFTIAGVVIMINGLGTLNDWTTRAIAFICLGLGFIFSIGAYIYNLYDGSSYEEYD